MRRLNPPTQYANKVHYTTLGYSYDCNYNYIAQHYAKLTTQHYTYKYYYTTEITLH